MTDEYVLLLDPAWSPDDGAEPPVEAIAGLWPMRADGTLGRFRSNPDYRPVDPDAPTDPIDSALRDLAYEQSGTDVLEVVLRDALVELALNGDGRPLLHRSPDDVLCAVIATAEPHRRRITAPQWLRVTVEEIAERLPDDVDLLINPQGPAAVRLTAGFVRRVAAISDKDLISAYERITVP
ncbi:type VII secretion system-associated protein [Actinoplanes sp. HUAS TT8]|uniref:type VII secretion system-associated protein n=1 Tax=Actinoplanes sp. HUAS TT8 TaxID=3447453 RepID=UPI003F51E1F9